MRMRFCSHVVCWVVRCASRICNQYKTSNHNHVCQHRPYSNSSTFHPHSDRDSNNYVVVNKSCRIHIQPCCNRCFVFLGMVFVFVIHSYSTHHTTRDIGVGSILCCQTVEANHHHSSSGRGREQHMDPPIPKRRTRVERISCVLYLVARHSAHR
eukprot:PhF_6_TR30458/c0_g1_i3/m.44742